MENYVDVYKNVSLKISI